MPVFKNKKQRDYTVISNDIMRHQELSWKAKGILCYLLSLPESWDIHLSELQKHATDGETSMRSGIDELKKAGYIVYRKIQDDKGHFSHEYWVYEHPQSPENPDVENRNMEKQNVENGKLLSTNELSTNELKNKEYIDQSTDKTPQTPDGLELIETVNGYTYPEEFEEAWQHYPRKIGKKATWRKWKARRKEGVDNSYLVAAAKNYAVECDKESRQSKFIKHPKTFFGPDEHYADYIEPNTKGETSEEGSKLINLQELYDSGWLENDAV